MSSSSSSSVSSLASDEYYVDRIVGKKRVGKRGKWFFFIKWEGYGEEDNTWEPRDNISPSLVLDYERRWKERMKKKNQQEPSKSSTGDRMVSSGNQVLSNKRQMTSGGDEMEEKRVKMGGDNKSNGSGFKPGLKAEEATGRENGAGREDATPADGEQG